MRFSPSSGRSCLFPFEDGFLDDGHVDPSLTPGLNSPTRCQNGERMERYSRKVFVGGLPPDIDEGDSEGLVPTQRTTADHVVFSVCNM